MSTRCDELQSLIKRGCSDAMIENPHGEQKTLKNKTVTNRRKGAEKLRPEDITQIQPQKLSLTLRSGENTFERSFFWSSSYLLSDLISPLWQFVLTTVTLCRWASNFQLKVQTSGRLSHRPVLLDGSVLLHEGRSGERQEPGNKSNAGDVKDHLWLQDRWGFSLWGVWSHFTLCFFLGQRN